MAACYCRFDGWGIYSPGAASLSTPPHRDLSLCAAFINFTNTDAIRIERSARLAFNAYYSDVAREICDFRVYFEMPIAEDLILTLGIDIYD